MPNLKVMRQSLLLVSMPLFYVNFALPLRAIEFGASALSVSALFSVFTICLLIVRPLAGMAIDRYGPKLFFISSLAFYVAAYAAYAASDSLLLICMARLIQGIAAALLLISVDIITANETLTRDVSEGGGSNMGLEMGRNLEVQTRATFFGATIGFGLLGFVPERAWGLSFTIFTALATLALVLTLFRWTEPKNKQDILPTKANAQVWQLMQARPDLKLFMCLMLLFGLANALIQPMYLIYLRVSFDVNTQLISLAFLPAGLVFAILPSKMGALADRFGATKLLLVGTLVSIFACISLPILANFYWAAGAFTLAAIAWAMIEPARKAKLVQLIEPTSLAQGLAWSEVAYGIGAVVGLPIGGYLFDNLGAGTPFYFSASVFIVAAGVGLILLKQPILEPN